MADSTGIVLGIITGIGIGLFFGFLSRSQKPWSELTEKEKNIRKILITASVLLLVAGIVTLLLFEG